MTIRAIQGVSGLSEVAFIGASRVRRRVSLVEQLPQIASPSVTVTLGANQAVPSLYNSVGLLQSYVRAESTESSSSGPLPGSNEALLQSELKSLLRLNADTSSSGISNATGVTANLSAGALQALNNVIANRLGETGGSERSQTESELLLQLLNLSSSRLSGATADLNIGSLSQGKFDMSSFSALLNSILGSGLDLSSLPIGSLMGGGGIFSGGTASLLGIGPSGIFGNEDSGLFGLATPSLLEIGAPGIFNLNATGAQAPGKASETAESASVGLARQAGAEGPTPASDRRDAVTALSASNVADSSAAPIIVSQPSPDLAVNQVAQTLPASINTAVTMTPNQTTDPARTAINTVAGNPTFAESVAALYLSAAVFRAQHHPGDLEVPESVVEVQPISAIKQVPILEAR